MSGYKMFSPKTSGELLTCLELKTESTMFIAGGTDIIVGLNEGKYKPDTIIDISHLNEFRYIEKNGDVIRIGALTTFSELQYSDIVLEYARALSVASSMVGSPQIRNAGTIGGNVGNASAAADTSTVLMALDATVFILNSNGETRTEKINDLVIRPNTTTLKQDEVMVAFEFKVSSNTKSGFAKVGSRTGVTISKMNACLIIQEVNGITTDVVVSLGAVGLKPFRYEKAEKGLLGKKLDDSFATLLQGYCQEAVDDSIRTRKSWSYKRVAVTGLALDVYDNYKSQ